MAKSGASNAKRQVQRHAARISRDLDDFGKSADVFSSDTPRLIEQYENQWVGVYKGKVAAHAPTLSKVKKAIEEMGIPLSQTMIRRVDREQRTYIL